MISVYSQTIYDKFISWLNGARYSITEPIMLRMVRARYEHLYSSAAEDPLVSVTIPTFNRGPLLIERSLSSVLAQTYQNLEVVIVGDACTDNTPALLAQIKDPRVRFVNLSQRGRYPQEVSCRWFVAGAKPANKTLELARGKWIAWLDDDDLFTSDHIEKLLRFAQKHKYEFVAGLYEEERNGTRTIAGHQSHAYPEYGGHSTWLYRSYLRFFKYNADSWRKSWNRPADIDLQLRMRSAGARMGALNQVVTYVLPRPGSSTVGLDAHESDAQKAIV